MDFDVIITCSGEGTRLKPLTDCLNKSLVKIGDKAIISYILDSYPKNSRFIITLGHLKEQVRDYIEINHPYLNIEFIDVDDFTSPYSSLLYSLSKTFHLINKPFYYNACDAYIADVKNLHNLDKNSAFVSLAPTCNQYRKFDINIKNDPAKKGEFCYTGVSYIKDYENFKSIALDFLTTKKQDLSDAHVIQKMNVSFIESDNWIDVGNHIALNSAQQKIKSSICVLRKKDEETYLVNSKIVKFFKDKQKVERLYQRNIQLSNCTPICDIKNNFIYYDYIEGETLSQILSEDLLLNFLQWCGLNLWVSLGDIDCNFFNEFYTNKAKIRVQKYEQSKNMLSPKINQINFRDVQPLSILLSKIYEKYHNHPTYTCNAHGDLVFENVIRAKDDFVLIDWREGFITNQGDFLYDIAKMKHNLIFDHEVIKNKGFYVKLEDGQCFFDPGTPKKNLSLISTLDNWCLQKSIDLLTLDTIVALIQLSSSGVHTGEEATLLYYMGWYNLNNLL